MKFLILTLLVGPICDDEDVLTCTIRFKNGSVVRGKAKGLEKVQLKTRYGTLEVPIKELRSIAWGETRKEERDTVVTADGTFRGWLEDFSSLEVDTGFGVLKIPAGSMKAFQVSRSGGLGDDFESGRLDSWTPNGTWTVTDGRLNGSSPGNYTTVILYNEELPDSYTLEVDVIGNNMAGLLWHAQNQQNATGLWMYPQQVGVYNGSGTFYSQSLATWQTNVPTAYTLRLEVDGPTTTVSINDVKIGTVQTQLRSGKVGFFVYQGSATFDNFRILR